MTTAEHIYAIQNLLNRGKRSDDAPFSNELIYHFMNQARMLLLKQKADKKQYISSFNLQGFCMPLKEDFWADCCDAPEPPCKMLKGCITIPKAISGRSNLYIKVYYLSGQEIGMTDISAVRFRQYSITKANKPAWLIENDELYITGIPFNRLKRVWVKGMFEDPAALADITTCNDNDEPCYDAMESPYPIDSELIDPMYRMVLDYLINLGSRSPQDDENNARATQLGNDKEE